MPGAGTDLCARFVDALPITGASIAVFDTTGHQSSVGSSDAIAARIDELQFELGEGPQWEAIRSTSPVCIPDVARDSHSRWPMFGTALQALDVGALFEIPLILSRVCVGAVGLYRRTPGSLAVSDLALAASISSLVSAAAVGRALASAGDNGPPETAASPAIRREVHQATGMILAQLETTAAVAHARLQAYAFSNGRTVHEVAHEVVSRQLNFRNLSE